MRPSEFLKDATLFDNRTESEAGKYLVQDIITDCSVVASLCSAASYEFSHKKQVPPTTHSWGRKPSKAIYFYIILFYFLLIFVLDYNESDIFDGRRKVSRFIILEWINS